MDMNLELDKSQANEYPEIAFWTGISLANGGSEERKELLGIALNESRWGKNC